MEPGDLPEWPELWAHAHEGAVLQRFHAGCQVSKVLARLKALGRHLPNHGAGRFQGLMGAIATGTHGSGLAFPPLAGLVRALLVARPDPEGRAGLELLVPDTGPEVAWDFADGQILTHPSGLPVRVRRDDDRFDATLVGLGCLGLVVEVVLAVSPGRPHLSETRVLTTWEAYKDRLLDEVR
jgi:xylitol oxidase